MQQAPLTKVPMELKVELTPTNGASLTGYEISYAEGSTPGTMWTPTDSTRTQFFVKTWDAGE